MQLGVQLIPGFDVLVPDGHHLVLITTQYRLMVGYLQLGFGYTLPRRYLNLLPKSSQVPIEHQRNDTQHVLDIRSQTFQALLTQVSS